MKISTKVEFGIVALADIAINSADGSIVSAAEISARQNISQKYLEQILVTLKQGGFIKGIKGSRGGYKLAKSSSSITFFDILNALDNNILSNDIDEEDDNGIRGSVNSCIWEELSERMRSFTKSMTLEEFINIHKNGPAKQEPMYYI